MRGKGYTTWLAAHPQLLDADWLYEQYIDCSRSLEEIGRNINVSSQTIYRRLRYYGIPIRPIGFKNRVLHQMWNTPTWNSWYSIHKRCDNPGNRVYDRYGGRGITLCAGWRGDEGFANFYADLGERPPGLTLDRIDNNGGYWCGHCSECRTNGWSANCRWADWITQNNNRRPAKPAPLRECPICLELLRSRGYRGHVTKCERNLSIAKRYAEMSSHWGARKKVALEFGVDEQIVKRAARRYRKLI
jgi:hypothetical protein